MVSGLSDEEEALVESLKSDLETMRTHVASKSNERATVESSVVALQSDLSGNLEHRAAALRETVKSTGLDASMKMTDDDDVEARQMNELREKGEELRLAEAEVDGVVKSIVKCEAILHGKRKKHSRLNRRLERDREEEDKISKELENDRELVEIRYNQKSIKRQKKADVEISIRELSFLPADFDKRRGLSMGGRMKKLKKTNYSLQKYSHLNKKALDQ